MGSTERRERARQETKRLILTSAQEIAREEGWPFVTLRKIAERIEYSHPAIYEHFGSKEDIFIELLREGFRILLSDLNAAQEEAAGCRDRIMQVALAYWQFAFRHPELYQVMHGLGGVPFGTADTPSEAQEVFILLRATLHPIIRDAGEEAPELDAAVDILWSTLHGLVSLTMAGRIAGGRERAALLIEPALRPLLAAWLGPAG